MNIITDKSQCCGCSACVQRCPKQCISMYEDEEGFLYPVVDGQRCINCGLCKKMCPVINQRESREPLKVYASKNKNEKVRQSSSSGGVFSLLVENIIRQDGIAFGAYFNKNYEVIHDSVETLVDAVVFCGSKYVQSNINNSFSKAEQYLKQGRMVLFSGTQCQIAGLRLYLGKEYDNLLTVEVVCHGVPSPKIWREYMDCLHIDKRKVTNILFKDKSSGWRGYSFSVVGENSTLLFSEKAEKNKYMMAFYQNLTLRPSCYSCPAKGGKSHADITLADYWGIENINSAFNDNVGVSMVCCNSEKGMNILKKISDSMNLIETDFNASVPFNTSIVRSTLMPIGRNDFWLKYKKEGISVLMALKSDRPSLIKRIFNRIVSR